MAKRSRGRLVIISGPSGAGKSSVLQRLRERCPLPLKMSVSATTRPPRPGEVDGREYFFLSSERFAALRKAGEFLETKEVFGQGRWYGTLRQQVTSGLEQGFWVILEIDVEGARAVLEQDLDPITIFIHPGSPAELERRLRTRGTESEADIAARLRTAAAEMEAAARYDHSIINDSVGRAADEICQILRGYQEPSECSKN